MLSRIARSRVLCKSVKSPSLLSRSPSTPSTSRLLSSESPTSFDNWEKDKRYASEFQPPTELESG